MQKTYCKKMVFGVLSIGFALTSVANTKIVKIVANFLVLGVLHNCLHNGLYYYSFSKIFG